jgi:hypothetical protein
LKPWIKAKTAPHASLELAVYDPVLPRQILLKVHLAKNGEAHQISDKGPRKKTSRIEDKNKGKRKVDRERSHWYEKLQKHEKREHKRTSPLIMSYMFLGASVL